MYKLEAEQWNKTHTCRVIEQHKTKDAAKTAAQQLTQCGYECKVTDKNGQNVPF
jgi:hypothetical protein